MNLRRLFAFNGWSLTFYRICLSLLVVFDLATRLPGLKTFYTDAGVIPRSFLLSFLETDSRISVFFLNGAVEITALFFLLATIATISLLVGWHTRLSTFVVWIFLMSLHIRNPMVNTNGDNLLRILLFWSLWMPLGENCSIDAKKKGWSLQQRNIVFSPGHIFYFFQIAFMYWFAAIIKFFDPVWFHGQGLLIALKDIGVGTNFGHLLATFPIVAKVVNHSVILFEALAPFLIFIPGRVRGISLVLLMLFHTSIGLCFRIGFFPLVSITALIPFIPSGFWNIFSTHLSKPIPVWPLDLAVHHIQWDVMLAGLYFILYVFFSNLQSLYPGLHVPLFEKVGKLVYLDQTWSVFTPPATYTVGQEISGRLKNGEVVDLITGKSSEKNSFRTWRGERYLFKTWGEKFDPTRSYVASYLCQEWNKKHCGKEILEQVEITSVYQYFYPTLQPAQKIPSLRVACGK